MRIYLSPQVNEEEKIEYEIDGEKITATYQGETDSFDFSEVPDGNLETEFIETNLDVLPIITAEKTKGVLSVELLNLIGGDATENEKFPEWIDAKDYKQPEEVEGETNGEVGVEK